MRTGHGGERDILITKTPLCYTSIESAFLAFLPAPGNENSRIFIRVGRKMLRATRHQPSLSPFMINIILLVIRTKLVLASPALSAAFPTTTACHLTRIWHGTHSSRPHWPGYTRDTTSAQPSNRHIPAQRSSLSDAECGAAGVGCRLVGGRCDAWSVVSPEGTQPPRWDRGADDAYDAGDPQGGHDGDSRDTMGDSGYGGARGRGGRRGPGESEDAQRQVPQQDAKGEQEGRVDRRLGQPGHRRQPKATLKKSRQNDVIEEDQGPSPFRYPPPPCADAPPVL